jgi:hypothetical protein
MRDAAEPVPARGAAPGTRPGRQQATRAVGRATEAAGLFLLHRTLIDLRLAAALRATSDADDLPEAIASTLWTLALAVSGLSPARAERDPGVRLYCGLAPDAAVPAALGGEREAGLVGQLRQAPAFRRQRGAETLSETVLAAFAFWLHGFQHSSPYFVAERFLRRSGSTLLDRDRLHVTLAPLSFDLVLGRAGYLDPLTLPAWLGGGRVSFSIRGAP